MISLSATMSPCRGVSATGVLGKFFSTWVLAQMECNPQWLLSVTWTNFWLWEYLKFRVYRGFPTTLVEVKTAIRLTVAVIDGDMLLSAVMDILTRLTCLLSCGGGGGNVEHLLR